MVAGIELRWFLKLELRGDYFHKVKTLQFRSKQDDGTWGEWQDVQTVTEENDD